MPDRCCYQAITRFDRWSMSAMAMLTLTIRPKTR
jgi:hypothetical protein